MLRKIAAHVIRGYQVSLRMALPSSCRFTPSCSEYALQAIVKFGFLQGSLKAIKRILSCHPFSGKTGYDPVI